MITYITYGSADIIKKACLVYDDFDETFGELLFQASMDLTHYIDAATLLIDDSNDFKQYSIGKRKFFKYHAVQIEQLAKYIHNNLDILNSDDGILTKGKQRYIWFYLQSIIRHANKLISMEVVDYLL